MGSGDHADDRLESPKGKPTKSPGFEDPRRHKRAAAMGDVNGNGSLVFSGVFLAERHTQPVIAMHGFIT